MSGETLSGEGWGGASWGVDRDPDVETRKHLEVIDRLLARLVEGSGDLSTAAKQALRAQLHAQLAAIGVDDIGQLMDVRIKLYKKLVDFPTPKDYPDKEEFERKLREQYSTAITEFLPRVPQHPAASEVSAYGQGDWRKVEGRGGVRTVDYLYNLGKIMSSEFVYTAFPSYADINRDVDPIRVGEGWRIANGRHRALTLRVLGPQYVDRKGMDSWVTVKREAPAQTGRARRIY
jgi:hypothetical protein